MAWDSGIRVLSMYPVFCGVIIFLDMSSHGKVVVGFRVGPQLVMPASVLFSLSFLFWASFVSPCVCPTVYFMTPCTVGLWHSSVYRRNEFLVDVACRCRHYLITRPFVPTLRGPLSHLHCFSIWGPLGFCWCGGRRRPPTEPV